MQFNENWDGIVRSNRSTERTVDEAFISSPTIDKVIAYCKGAMQGFGFAKSRPSMWGQEKVVDLATQDMKNIIAALETIKKQRKEAVEDSLGNDGSPLQEAASIDRGRWYVKNEHPKDRSIVLIYGPYDSEAHANRDDSWETGGLILRGADLMKKVRNGKIVELGREKKIEFVKGKR